MAKPLPKLLLIFNPEEVLCRLNRSKSISLRQDVDPNTLVLKDHLQDFVHFLFVRNRLYIKVAAWTKGTAEHTDWISKKVFSDYSKQLLFKYSSPSTEIDLQQAWANFPEYSKTNTAFVDINSNSVTQKSSVLLFPPFALDDSLTYFQEYMRFFSYQYTDGRIADLENYIQRVKFLEYYSERSKFFRGKPVGEASRFW